MLPSPKAILFDWDNTLADTWPTIHLAWTETLQAMGHEPWSLEVTKERVHRSMRDTFPVLFGEQWKKAADTFQQSYLKHRYEALLPLPHAEDVLSYLQQETKCYVAVVSNKKGTSLREEIIHLSWQHYFATAVGADDAKADKPSPEPVHMALEQSAISVGSDVWFVGDSITDMECAHRAGCTPILYGVKEAHPEIFASYPPAYCSVDHQAFFALLKQSGT